MSTGFKYYPLIGGGLGGAYKKPLDSYRTSKESAFKISNYCLEGIIPGMYRLIARHATDAFKYRHFTIKCPDCGGTMQEMLPARNKTELPVYVCTCCNR